MKKVHILEGTHGGRRLYACGTPDSGDFDPYVARAKLKECGSAVTCKRCRAAYVKRYAMVLPDAAQVGGNEK